MGNYRTVANAAEALGTSPQTVRTLLRKGELAGRKRAWGDRYLWEVSQEGIDNFLLQFGRLDGHRRPRRVEPAEEPVVGDVPPDLLPSSPDPLPILPSRDAADPFAEPEREPRRRPFVLRPRGRATVVVVVLGVPLCLAYAAARVALSALWYDELDQAGVFDRVFAAKVEFSLLVTGTVALGIAAVLALTFRGTRVVRRRTGVLALTAVALVTGSLFSSASQGHWQTYLLWRHRQDFAVVDPTSGKDVGFFVFTLPFELLISALLLWLVVVAAGYVVIVHLARRTLNVRPLRASFRTQVDLAVLAAIFLLALAWRGRLECYRLELAQPSFWNRKSFAGAQYVDVHVRSPGLVAVTILAVVLAAACLTAPYLARTGPTRRARAAVGIPGALLVIAVALVAVVIPALVQRFVVSPNPLLSEQPFLARSIAATRMGLGLDAIDVQPYSPTGSFRAADFAPVSQKLANIAVWDTSLLGARMRQLVTETPYYRPNAPTLDVVPVDGQRQPTVVSTRELDLRLVPGRAGTWVNNRLAYTHGVGVVRFSGTDIDTNREPRLIDAGLSLSEPRIYFGNPRSRGGDGSAKSPWVIVDTRRPEVDLPASATAPQTPYHYDGTGGIALSSWARRAVFAVALRSKDLLLSHDITPASRVLLHQDVEDRLHTLAPFIQWDSHPVPITSDGRVVYVVDGYTTSANYPNAQRVDLHGNMVNYARASVRATVDAFSGRVAIYLTDTSDPIARALAQTFPTLFHPDAAMPPALLDRLRYPTDLFAAQATTYERFHTTRTDLFVSGADAWSRPTALSGTIEVAGDVNFDESDEDDLRLTMQPAYTFAPPPGNTDARLVLTTYYSPRRGQNLVSTLTGWIDDQGRARLNGLNLAPAPVTLGPAQISRLVFATPRVSNLLGLRNLETRDLDRSSIDSVVLGQPHLVFLPSGVVQLQSLYEGSRGPGAARLLGVTVFLNGRAGLGPDVESAVRQALNEPPRITVVHPREPVVVRTRVQVHFEVKNAQREVVTISSPGGTQTQHHEISTGLGTISWVPSAVGEVTVRVEVTGLDGTLVSGSTTVSVVSPAPTLRLGPIPTRVAVGGPVRVSFNVKHVLHVSAIVSTRYGVVFTRDYLIRHGTGIINWTPDLAGPAVLLIRASGHQGQTVSKTVHFTVKPGTQLTTPPAVSLLSVPDAATVGRASDITFQAAGCSVAVARVEGPGGDVRDWQFPCPVDRATFSWTPAAPGTYLLSVVALGTQGQTSSETVPITVVANAHSPRVRP
jgi:uncharacterized membrane protein (UPF0182 family)